MSGAAVRSALHWSASVLHFFPACTALVALGFVIDRRRLDPAVRLFCRNVARIAGARVEVVRDPGADPGRPALFVANHVNLFDPFVLYPALPRFTRGVELESHFRIPVYGWLMRSFGNVPVPVRASHEAVRRLKRGMAAAFGAGTSLLAFPEGTRTRTGAVGPLRPGLFRIAIELGVPVVPVSQAGAFAVKRPERLRLTPGPVRVRVHDAIETAGLREADAPTLAARVRAILEADVEGGV